jgi:hypothetical protein
VHVLIKLDHPPSPDAQWRIITGQRRRHEVIGGGVWGVLVALIVCHLWKEGCPA